MGHVGSAKRAAEIAEYHHFGCMDESDVVEQIGAGSHRTVYLDYATSVVYKIGNDGANRQEVRILTELREAGVPHAPAATLYEVTVADIPVPLICTVVAMPYLPDDGTVPGPYPILEGAADLNPTGNVHGNCGRLWLIDAGGL